MKKKEETNYYATVIQRWYRGYCTRCNLSILHHNINVSNDKCNNCDEAGSAPDASVDLVHIAKGVVNAYVSEEALPVQPGVYERKMLESSGKNVPQANLHLSITNPFASRFGGEQVSTQHFGLNNSMFGLPAPYFEQFQRDCHGRYKMLVQNALLDLRARMRDTILVQNAMLNLRARMSDAEFAIVMQKHPKSRQQQLLFIMAAGYATYNLVYAVGGIIDAGSSHHTHLKLVAIKSSDDMIEKSQRSLEESISNPSTEEAYSEIAPISSGVPYTERCNKFLLTTTQQQNGNVMSIARDAVYWFSKGSNITFLPAHVLDKSQSDESSRAAELYAIAQQEHDDSQTVIMDTLVSDIFTETLSANKSVDEKMACSLLFGKGLE